MKRQKGSITIYMLLSVVLVMAMVFTVTESARMKAVDARLKNVTFMAADSCFAEYAREVFDQYGVMVLWKQENQFLSSYNRYIQKNLDPGELGLYQDADLYLAEHDASLLTEVRWITGSNGRDFISQVCEYMNYFFLEETAVSILEDLKLLQSGSQIADFVQKINGYAEVFLKVGTVVNKIQNTVDKIRSLAYNPKSILDNMLAFISQYEETGQKTWVTQFYREYRNLRNGRNKMGKYLQSVLADTQSYYLASENSESAIAVLKQEVEEKSDNYTEDTLAVIRQQLEDLARKADGQGSDYYRVKENEQNARSCVQQLGSLDSLFQVMENAGNGRDITEWKGLLEGYRLELDSFPGEELGLSSVGERIRPENTGFLDTIRQIFSKGLLNAVTDGRISKASVNVKNLPSRTADRGGASGGSGLFAAGYRRLASAEYVLTHFSNYREPLEERALNYEAEYILSGKSSDRDNLEAAVRKLAALREGLNMVSFMKDPQKMSEAESLALAIAGFTGMEALVTMVKLVIISVWCMAESLCDVKTLLRGGRIGVIKEPFEWTVSAIGLKSFSKDVLPAVTDSKGFSYSDYLRLLLLQEKEADLAYRCMDLIQLNMCRNHQPGFRMEDCICGVSVETVYHAGPLFTAFPFIEELTGLRKGTYPFLYHQEYAY